MLRSIAVTAWAHADNGNETFQKLKTTGPLLERNGEAAPVGRSLAQHIDLTEDAPLSINRDVRIDPRPLGLMTGKSNRDDVDHRVSDLLAGDLG